MNTRLARIAVIDIGSNAIRCTVADVLTRDALMIVADERIQTRLASGLVHTGRLSDESMAASHEAIAVLLELTREHRAAAVRAIATAAVRTAANGQEFVDRVHSELGLAIEVIDGQREARLALTSAAAAFELPDPVCVADIGGASLEVVVLRGDRPERTLSLSLGAVVVGNRLATGDAPPPPSRLEQVRVGIREEIGGSLGLIPSPVPTAICSGGTITSLIGATNARRGGSPVDIHGVRASIEELREIADEVATATLTERGRIPGIPPYRAQTVLPGSLVMMELFSLLGTDTVIANRRGIREGLMIEMARQLRTSR
ncbi:MAG: Ppx/GppA phosphatase family protein [Coriobacteriia bacterium]